MSDFSFKNAQALEPENDGTRRLRAHHKKIAEQIDEIVIHQAVFSIGGVDIRLKTDIGRLSRAYRDFADSLFLGQEGDYHIDHESEFFRKIGFAFTRDSKDDSPAVIQLRHDKNGGFLFFNMNALSDENSFQELLGQQLGIDPQMWAKYPREVKVATARKLITKITYHKFTYLAELMENPDTIVKYENLRKIYEKLYYIPMIAIIFESVLKSNTRIDERFANVLVLLSGILAMLLKKQGINLMQLEREANTYSDTALATSEDLPEIMHPPFEIEVFENNFPKDTES